MKRPGMLLVSLSALGLFLAPAWATIRRYPNDQEMGVLTQTFRRDLPKYRKSVAYRDRRTPEQKQQIAAFTQAWAAKDPAAAPFLGSWVALEEMLLIYPSGTRGQVCIIERFLPRSDGKAADFTLGTVAQGRIRTTDRNIVIKEQEFLGLAFVYQGKPGIYAYANPKPLPSLALLEDIKRSPQILQAFKRAGCRTDLP